MAKVGRAQGFGQPADFAQNRLELIVTLRVYRRVAEASAVRLRHLQVLSGLNPGQLGGWQAQLQESDVACRKRVAGHLDG